MRTPVVSSSLLLSILAISIVFSTPPVFGVSSPQGFAATISQNYVSVAVNFQIFQNLTILESSFVLPQFSGLLTSANASSIETAIQQSLQVKSPQATVKGLSLTLAATPFQNTTQIQWFNITLQFQVQGVQTTQGGAEKTDLAWKSFAVPQNLTIGGVEVNNIGARYLQSVAAQIAAMERLSSSSTFLTFRNVVSQRNVSPASLESASAAINLLNLTGIQSPLDSWKKGYDSKSLMESWSFNVGSSLGIIITETPNEPQATPSKFLLSYSLQASVSAPIGSSVKGDQVIVVFGNDLAIIMGSVIGSVVVLGSVSFAYERRILNRSTSRRSKRYFE